MRHCHHHVMGAALAAVALASCGAGEIVGRFADQRLEGSGDVRSETRSVDAFDRVVLDGEGRVLLGAGSDGQIEIETDDNLIERIEVDVSGDTLTIRTESGVDIDPTDGVTYRLGCPSITGVELNGAGDIELEDCTTTDRLELTLAGAGRIEAHDLAVQDLRVRLPGAGTVEVDGRADELDVRLSGAARFDGGDLEAAEAVIESSGVGVATVWVTDTLDATLSGVGSVRYYGDPSVTESVDGVGGIESLGPRER